MKHNVSDREKIGQSFSAITAYKTTHGYEPSFTKMHWAIANKIGIYEALIIQIIESWCISNQQSRKYDWYYHYEHWWTSSSYKEWQERYPALGTEKSIKNRILEMEKKGYIFSCQPKRDKGQNSKFYRVNQEKVGYLLLNDISVVSSNNAINSTEDYRVPKSSSVVTNSDLQNKTEGYLVNNSDQPPSLIVTNPVTNSDQPPAESQSQREFQASLLDQEIKSIYQISGVGENERNMSKDEGANAPRKKVQINNSSIADKQIQDPGNNQSLSHGVSIPAAPRRNNNSSEISNNVQNVHFDSDPCREEEFLVYYMNHPRRQYGDKVIAHPSRYLAKCLKNGGDGAVEIKTFYKEWMDGCQQLQRKITVAADNPIEIERKRRLFDFDRLQNYQVQGWMLKLQSLGVAKFCKTSDRYNAFYEWALKKFPEQVSTVPV
jgi:hypothetical protein